LLYRLSYRGMVEPPIFSVIPARVNVRLALRASRTHLR